MTRTLTGATATIRYNDTGETLAPVYISFGQYDEETERDTYGVNDLHIFFYCENEAELVDLMTESKANDFTVVGYELEYNEVTV